MNRRTWMLVGIIGVVVLVGAVVAARGAGDKRQEWAKSGHANRQLAVDEATVEGRAEFAAHCARCHAEQGFLAWLPQLNKGNIGLLTQPDGSAATVPYLASLGLTKFTVRPQTCTTCHTPEYGLRVRGDTALLPAGFQAKKVGAGALCMTCHNTRNGPIQFDATDAKRFTAPHTAAQADVIMGKNVFFVNFRDNYISPHAAFVGDSCVTCHVTMNPDSHTFKASKEICSNCHGPAMKAEYVQVASEGLIEDLGHAISARVLAGTSRIATVTAWDPKTDQTTANVAVTPSQITGADLTEIHGQIGLKFTLTGGRELYSQLGEIKNAAGSPAFATSDPIVRASWNYFLFHSDGSKGVHNPRFYRAVIQATLDALK